MAHVSYLFASLKFFSFCFFPSHCEFSPIEFLTVLLTYKYLCLCFMMHADKLPTVCSFQFSLLRLVSRIRAVFSQDQIFPIPRQVSFVHFHAR